MVLDTLLIVKQLLSTHVTERIGVINQRNKTNAEGKHNDGVISNEESRKKKKGKINMTQSLTSPTNNWPTSTIKSSFTKKDNLGANEISQPSFQLYILLIVLVTLY